MKNLILFLFITVAVYGCNSENKPQIKHEPLAEAVLGTWQGTIPCADCPGIKYELNLKPNQTYLEQSIYLEENVKPFIREGRWEISEDSIITLSKENTGMRYFKFTGEVMKMLDTQKQPITTELAEFYILERKDQNE